MGCGISERYIWVFLGLVAALSVEYCYGMTDPRDVVAINGLYASLGFPLLTGWMPYGGDPCGDGWQGIQCVNSNITGIILPGANLGGELGDNIGKFASIMNIDLGHNHIEGIIPSNLPMTLRTFCLSGNQFTGSIPGTLASLGQLAELLLNDNHLIGGIPDAFQLLMSLSSLDLSGNSLSGQLPPSMANMSSLTTLHLQNNQLTGTLDVLQDLPLMDLNIENNMFSGPIPDKLMRIPNFRRDGNPFNTSVVPLPPALSPLPSSSGAPPPMSIPGKPALEPSVPEGPSSAKGGSFFTTKKVILIGVAGALILAALVLGLCLCMSKCWKGSRRNRKMVEKDNMGGYNYRQEKPISESFPKMYSPPEKDHKDLGLRPAVKYGKDHQSSSLRSLPRDGQVGSKRMIATSKPKEDHEIDMTSVEEEDIVQPPPPPPPAALSRNQSLPLTTTKGLSNKIPSSVRSFSIASLQQYTDSFSEENLIGRGTIGSVYQAELPSGEVLAVKKLDPAACRKMTNEDFLELVLSLSKLRHPNIVELVGYCDEHGQHLLVYNYFDNGTLHEALNFDDEFHKKLSWNARVRIALGSARALEYLHEVCQPAIVHQNFKTSNILLDDNLEVHVSDCGLAPVMSLASASQLSVYSNSAPELELGNYTTKSDVYHFGVVMLEILTGRKSYDRSRPRGEQSLVRWASHQLHDIDALSRMVDPSLNGAYSTKSLSRFADIISLCLQPEPEFRPPMSEIVVDLLHMVERQI